MGEGNGYQFPSPTRRMVLIAQFGRSSNRRAPHPGGARGGRSLEGLDDDAGLQQLLAQNPHRDDEEPENVPFPGGRNAEETTSHDGEAKSAHPAEGVTLLQEALAASKAEPEPLGQENEPVEGEERSRIRPPRGVDDADKIMRSTSSPGPCDRRSHRLMP